MGCCQSVRKKRASVAKKILNQNLDEDTRQLYSMIDLDNDGQITYKEILVALKKAGVELSERQAADFVNAHDLDGDGFIDYGELKRMLRNTMKQRSSNLVAFFKLLDMNKDNAIDCNEFVRGMNIIGEQISKRQVQDMMHIYYKLPGDKINFEQFCMIFHKFV